MMGLGHIQHRYCGTVSLLLITALLIHESAARKFRSRDADVRKVIEQCEERTALDPSIGDTPCQATLGCILRSIGAYTAARWSGGASILAFIPTITAVMSNSIEEVVQIAEEDSVLGIMLGLCSVTVFASRFGSDREAFNRTPDAIVDHVRTLIEKTVRLGSTANKSPGGARRAVFCMAYAVLLAACFTVWFPTTVILRNGVVVFSCPWQIHIPIWIGLTQAVVVGNVVLLRYCFERKIVEYQPVRQPGQARKSKAPSKEPLKHRIVLRSTKSGFVPRFIRGFTSTITFALYAFATATFGAMTMFTASDAVWCMVMFAFAAGMGRVVANFVIEDSAGFRRTIVVSLQAGQVDLLRVKIENTIEQITAFSVQDGNTA